MGTASRGSDQLLPTDPSELIDRLLAARTAANEAFFDREAERITRLCHLMAERFARGGRLLSIGRSPAARSDVRHVAVEFVHPVIVGKRALPALGLAAEGGDLAEQVDLLGSEPDIVIAFKTEADGGEAARALALARERGCLTIAFPPACSPAGAEYEFDPPSDDEFVRQELIETLYHVLWELVHVFFDHRGLLQGRNRRQVHDAGASSFLYPFLAEQESELEPVIEDVRRSVLMKSAEIGELRTRTLGENRGVLMHTAAQLRDLFDGAGKLLALGNGGSATDAMDLVADLRARDGRFAPRAAIDLTEDAAILTAVANDIGTQAIFSRQVIAHGEAGDAVLALSTSGNSRSVIEALGEARRGGLRTVAFVGYDGGQVLAEGLADHVVVVRSEHIPRIQEAQATAYHVLRELVG
jgi:D-sedoheptulose 7-phosphate isomerase